MAADEEKLRTAMGRRCALARTLLQITQGDLAERLSKSRAWVAQIERGAQFPPPFLLVELARLSGLSLGWFYALPEQRDAAAVRRLERGGGKVRVGEAVPLEDGLADLHVLFGPLRTVLPDVGALRRELELRGVVVDRGAGPLAATRGELLDLAMDLIRREMEREGRGGIRPR